jgi:hypothetical protein
MESLYTNARILQDIAPLYMSDSLRDRNSAIYSNDQSRFSTFVWFYICFWQFASVFSTFLVILKMYSHYEQTPAVQPSKASLSCIRANFNKITLTKFTVVAMVVGFSLSIQVIETLLWVRDVYDLIDPTVGTFWIYCGNVVGRWSVLFGVGSAATL